MTITSEDLATQASATQTSAASGSLDSTLPGTADDPSGDRSTQKISQPQPTLGSLLEPGPAAPGQTPPLLTAQVVNCSGADIVLIGPSPGSADGTVEVADTAGVLATRQSTQAAEFVADPAQRENVLRRTLSRLASRFRDIETARREAADATRRGIEARDELLSRLRSYAISLYNAGDLDRGQLDDFLGEFSLPGYELVVRVEYTIRGSYLVIDSDTDEAESDARGYLRPDLSELDRIDDDSSDFSVNIDGVEQIGDGG